MKPANLSPFISGLSSIHHISSINDVDPAFLDDYLLEQFLRSFLSPTSSISTNIAKIKSQDQVKAIQERISKLNQAIQLEERCKIVGNYPILTVRDIMVSWEESHLQYALMMDEELLELKASDVPKLSLFTVAGSVLELAKSQKMSVDQDTLTPSSIQDMRLVDVPHLNGETFNRLGKDVPPIAFSLISQKAIPELDMTSLTPKQQKVFFSIPGRVRLLTMTQVNTCVPTIKLKFLKYLSDKQIHNLDFSQINQDIFEAIFKLNTTRTSELLSKMPDKQIIALKPFLKLDWHKYLSDHQKMLIT